MRTLCTVPDWQQPDHLDRHVYPAVAFVGTGYQPCHAQSDASPYWLGNTVDKCS